MFDFLESKGLKCSDICLKRQTKGQQPALGFGQGVKVWQKSLAFAHIATARLNITSVLKLAHFIRSGSLIPAVHATRASSLVSITLLAEQIFATTPFKASQCPQTA